MRALVITVLLFAAACRCFEPVYEELDGGAGGGSAGGGGAAGGAAGGAPADAGCAVAAQCTAPHPATSLCNFVQRDAGFSCIDSSCVFECTPGRTCSTAEDAGCLSCGTDRSCAPALGCGFTQAAVIEADNGCPAAFPTELSLQPIGGVCGWTVSDTSGRVVGTVYSLENGTFLAHLPGLGGTCVGFSLFTQVERWVLSCPACQLELRL